MGRVPTRRTQESMSINSPLIVYYSTQSENTKRFIEKLGFDNVRIPEEGMISIDRPYVLVTPTYSGGKLRNAVPKPVIHFLNKECNRTPLKGVIGTGNTNFGKAYCLASRVIADKCNVPNLAQVELFGTPEDVDNVQRVVTALFKTH